MTTETVPTDVRSEPFSIRETLAAMLLEHDAGGITLTTLGEARQHLSQTNDQIIPNAVDRDSIARIVIGPRNAVPNGSSFTLRQLQDLRWERSTNQERAEALWIADAILATLPAPAPEAIQDEPAVREGFVLVPVEPTEAMLDAYWKQTGESKEMRSRTHAYMRRYWSAMIAAARRGEGQGDG